jgi:hypothetical protein
LVLLISIYLCMICFTVLSLHVKLIVFCPVSLPQLVGQLHYIYRGLGFEPRSSHLSTLCVEFQAIRLHDKKKVYNHLPLILFPSNLGGKRWNIKLFHSIIKYHNSEMNDLFYFSPFHSAKFYDISSIQKEHNIYIIFT